MPTSLSAMFKYCSSIFIVQEIVFKYKIYIKSYEDFERLKYFLIKYCKA